MARRRLRQGGAPVPPRTLRAPAQDPDTTVAPKLVPPTRDLDAPAPRRLLSYQVANVQGIGTREEQQDSFGTINAMDVTLMSREGLFAVVADGMGGMTGGREASVTTVQTFMDGFRRRDPSQDVYQGLMDAAIDANGRVFEMLHNDGGSTVVACVLWQERLWYLSLGDSYLFLLRDGVLVRVNEEHNSREEKAVALLRDGIFDREQVDHVDEASAVTSFVGTGGSLRFDGFYQPLPLEDGDVMLICSDGIGGALEWNVIAHCLERPSALAACQELDRDIQDLADPFQDNYTGIVIRCMR